MKKSNTVLGLNIFLVAIFYLLANTAIAAKPDTISFLHITDIHVVYNLDLFQKDLAENRSNYDNGVEPFKAFLKNTTKQTKADFVVATGDLIDFYEGEAKDKRMLDFQVEKFVKQTKKSKVPVYLTLGNHDIISYSWGDNERISSQKNAEKAETVWTKTASCFKDGTYYSTQLKIGETTFRLIYLNNGYYDFPDEENENLPYVDKPQLHWLEGQLLESDEDIEIIFMHIPIKNKTLQSEAGIELFSVLQKYPSVKLILAGHNHTNIIRQFPTEKGNEITQVQTAAFASDPKNWRQIKLCDNKILVSQQGNLEKEIEIDLH